jgi:hypothetical protein
LNGGVSVLNALAEKQAQGSQQERARRERQQQNSSYGPHSPPIIGWQVTWSGTSSRCDLPLRTCCTKLGRFEQIGHRITGESQRSKQQPRGRLGISAFGDRRPLPRGLLGKPSASSKPHCVNGLTPKPISPQITAPSTCQPGCIDITGTGHTPVYNPHHPSAALA